MTERHEMTILSYQSPSLAAEYGPDDNGDMPPPLVWPLRWQRDWVIIPGTEIPEPPAGPAPARDYPVTETMIRLVQEQIPTASREAAVAALERNKGNVVDAIMDLDSVIR